MTSLSIDKIKKYILIVNPLKFKNERVISLSKIGTGEMNAIYLLTTSNNKYLLRFDMKNRSKEQIQNKFKLLQEIKDLGIAPKPYYIDCTKKYFRENFVIISYQEGKHIVNDSKFNIAIPKLAKAIAKVHNAKIKIVNKNALLNHKIKEINKRIKLIKKDKKRYSDNDNLDELFEIYSRDYKKFQDKLKQKFCFCHNDICIPNTIYNQGKIYFIDWDSAGLNDPAFELAYHFYEFKYSNKQKEKFLKCYFKDRKDPTLLKRLEFTKFFVAFDNYIYILIACFDIANKKGHKEYLCNANLKEYWDWGNYYLENVIALKLFNNKFSDCLRKDIAKIYKILRK